MKEIILECCGQSESQCRCNDEKGMKQIYLYCPEPEEGDKHDSCEECPIKDRCEPFKVTWETTNDNTE